FLGHRRRIPQPARRPRRRRVLDRFRISPRRCDVTMPSFVHKQVNVGDELPPLSVVVTSTTIVLGALATRDWRPQHHDYHFATERNGVRDIFMSSPNQAAWFERYITDWTGPRARLGRPGFRMGDSVFPGDTMTMTGLVTSSDV